MRITALVVLTLAGIIVPQAMVRGQATTPANSIVATQPATAPKMAAAMTQEPVAAEIAKLGGNVEGVNCRVDMSQ